MTKKHEIYLLIKHSNGQDVPEHDLESLKNSAKAHGFEVQWIQRTTDIEKSLMQALVDWWRRLPP